MKTVDEWAGMTETDQWEEYIRAAMGDMNFASPDPVVVRLERELEEAKAEIERLRAKVDELSTPNWCWDDRDLEMCHQIDEIGEYDDVGDIFPVRPIRELPMKWALVTEDETLFFDSEEQAEAAKQAGEV